jgi:hypothetical protein
MIESVIRRELEQKVQSAQVCFVVDVEDNNLRIYPLNRKITSRLIEKIELVLDSFGGFFDYVIEYDDERKSVYIYIGGV